MSDLFQNMSDIFFATSETALKPARKIPTTADNVSTCPRSHFFMSASCFTAKKKRPYTVNPYCPA